VSGKKEQLVNRIKEVGFVVLFSIALSGAESHNGVRLFYRILGARSNGPYVRKTRTVAAPDGAPRTASTGMADSGFTEYPFCSGRWSFSFREFRGLFPRIASHVPIDPSGENTCDILVDWVYEPDGCVWGPSCREFGQTFTARGRELVAVTLLVPSPEGDFVVSLHRDGPGGPETAPRKNFVSGNSLKWGTARWGADEAPLAPGRTYYLRIRRRDGAPWTPYFHAAGNVYEGGIAYFGGIPRPESDLALWIMEEPPEVSRAVILNTDSEGRVKNTTGVYFSPRTPNVRLITVEVTPVEDFCVNLVAFVREGGSEGRPVCGPKYNLACARPGTFYQGNFLFGPKELDVKPGGVYFVEVFYVPFKEGCAPEIPDNRSKLPLRDVKAYVYGETCSEPLPVIFNVKTRFRDEETLVVSWRLSKPAGVAFDLVGTDGIERATYAVPPGKTEAVIEGLRPGEDCDFRLRAFASSLRSDMPPLSVWRTPIYRIRMPGGDPAPVLWPETPKSFVPLAPRPVPGNSKKERPFCRRADLRDGDFENGLGAWKETKGGIGCVSGKEAGIAPVSGERMYGWTHRAKGERRDVLLENGIFQTIDTEPGRWYEVRFYAITDVGSGPRGDTRVRVAVDVKGGRRPKPADTSQWYWTDGRWLLITHLFKAEAERATVEIDFFRWRDLERSSAYVDSVEVVEVGGDPF